MLMFKVLFRSLFIITGSGLSAGAIAGICAIVLLVPAAAAVLYYRHRICDRKHVMGKYYSSYSKCKMSFIMPQ